jgi:hypothetical protein
MSDASAELYDSMFAHWDAWYEEQRARQSAPTPDQPRTPDSAATPELPDLYDATHEDEEAAAAPAPYVIDLTGHDTIIDLTGAEQMDTESEAEASDEEMSDASEDDDDEDDAAVWIRQSEEEKAAELVYGGRRLSFVLAVQKIGFAQAEEAKRADEDEE